MASITEAANGVAQGLEVASLQRSAATYASRIAREYGLDPNRFVGTFIRLIGQESGWNARAHNETSGASGIAQIVPRWHPDVNPWNAEEALAYAARYLAENITRYGGDFLRGVAAYNAGPGTVDAIARQDDQSFVGSLPGETQTYVSRILGGGDSNTVVQSRLYAPGGGDVTSEYPQQQRGPTDLYPEDEDPWDPWDPRSRANPTNDPTAKQPNPQYIKGPDGSTYYVDPSDPLHPVPVFPGTTADTNLSPYQEGELAQGWRGLELRGQELAESQRQSAYRNAIAALQGIQEERTLAETQRQNARDTLRQAAPYMAAGRDWYGGTEPGGPMASIARYGGFSFRPQQTQMVPLDVNPAPAPVDPAVMQRWYDLMGVAG